MEQNQTTGPEIPSPQVGEVHNNTLMAVLAYLGILIIIPFLTEAKNDPFVKFHMKQGLALLIGWIIAMFIYRIPVIGLLGGLLDLGLLILMIIGIINAVSGKQTELPLIGSFAKSFNF